ncbi:MAG: hypothetical protein ACXIU7_08795 [Roseinatronobacter sp.]
MGFAAFELLVDFFFAFLSMFIIHFRLGVHWQDQPLRKASLNFQKAVRRLPSTFLALSAARSFGVSVAVPIASTAVPSACRILTAMLFLVQFWFSLCPDTIKAFCMMWTGLQAAGLLAPHKTENRQTRKDWQNRQR